MCFLVVASEEPTLKMRGYGSDLLAFLMRTLSSVNANHPSDLLQRAWNRARNEPYVV